MSAVFARGAKTVCAGRTSLHATPAGRIRRTNLSGECFYHFICNFVHGTKLQKLILWDFCPGGGGGGGGVIDQPSVIISAWAGHISEISAEMSDRTNRIRSSAGISATLEYKNCV